MFYRVVDQKEKSRQLSLDDFLTGKVIKEVPFDSTGTVTSCAEKISPKYQYEVMQNAVRLNARLEEFNEKYADLIEADKNTLYDSWKIPKKHGGLRKIDAPKEELRNALDELVSILKNDFGCRKMYHTSAFAYMEGRSTVKCARRHASNESKWFARFDIHDFFGSTTLEFVLEMLKHIYPFNILMCYTACRDNLAKALSLGFKNGGLPQGTPLSPIITNIMMIPFDFTVANGLRKFKVEKDGREFHQSFVYTRYSDDMYVSSRYDFNPKQIEDYICNALKEQGAPFELNREKTKYNSNQGSVPNWILGVQINAQNDITVGRKRKKNIEAALLTYAKDAQSGIQWELGDLRHMMGELSYIKSVEAGNYKKFMERVNEKAGFNVWKAVNEEIKCRVC